MKLGADPKKVAILGGLLLVAGYFVITNMFSGPTPQTASPAARARTEIPPEIRGPSPRAEVRKTRPSRLQEFRPSLKPRKPGESVDLSSIDATLRLDLLAKLQEVKSQGGERSLFDFGSVPVAKPEPKVIPKPIYTVALPPPPPAAPPPPPPPPRITLRFYGYTMPAPQGAKRAFFLDGEEILIGAEGDVLKKRYRVVKIGVNSVVMEDMQNKSEQTLPLEPQVV
jgi:hypothetical protein